MGEGKGQNPFLKPSAPGSVTTSGISSAGARVSRVLKISIQFPPPFPILLSESPLGVVCNYIFLFFPGFEIPF